MTISDTRTRDDDRSGELIRQNLIWRGHEIGAYEIVPDDPARIREQILAWVADDTIEAVITNGGTGIAGRDNTYEAISGLLEKRLDGFGELFRMLSFPGNRRGRDALPGSCRGGRHHGDLQHARIEQRSQAGDGKTDRPRARPCGARNHEAGYPYEIHANTDGPLS